MKTLNGVIGAALVLASAVSAVVPVPAHATGVRSHTMRRCAFRSHAWGVVQATSELITFADIDSRVNTQSAAAHLQERYFRVEQRYGSPYGSEALFSDLTTAWSFAESMSYDNEQWNSAGSDQMQYWDDQQASDTSQAWAAEANAWADVKATC